MRKFEYKAVPAPTTGTKAKGVKTTEDRFSLSLTNVLNEMAEDGWEYVRAETLPVTERKGLTGSQQTYQNILIFRKPTAAALPLDRTTSRPLTPIVEEYEAPEVEDTVEATVEVEEPEIETPRITTEPAPEGNAPRIRAFED